MLTRETLILLRLPFSIFLAPIFFFALGEAGPLDPLKTLLIAASLHLFLYPASNGFNSYYDKDEGSIGGIERPPKPTENLLFWSLVFDLIALTLGAFVSPWFVLGLFVYGMFSKFYSWDMTRWKKYPLFSWLGIGLIQGTFTFLMVALFAGARMPEPTDPGLWAGAILIGLFLLSGYPLTQVYQHDEDRKRGDRTMSMLLGIKGTFVFCGALFGLTAAGFFWYYAFIQVSWLKALLFLAAQGPLALFFLGWTIRVFRDQTQANFQGALRLNLLSTGFMNVFFATSLFY